jgi:hypothetical protein
MGMVLGFITGTLIGAGAVCKLIVPRMIQHRINELNRETWLRETSKRAKKN